jgi:hypothetical protein
MDDLDQDLAALAPNVDAAAARSVFDVRRTKLRRRRRVTTGVVGVLAMVGLAGGIAALAQDRDERLEVGDDGRGPVGFEVLEVIDPAPGFHDLVRLRLVGDAAQLDELAGADVDVDFDTQVVVAISVPYDLCIDLAGFDRDGRVLEPVFDVPGTVACNPRPEPAPATFVVALDRSSLGDADRLHVAADDAIGMSEASIRLPSPLPFEVLAIEETTEAFGTLRAATDEAGLATLWAEVGIQDVPVDLSRWVVVSFTVANDNCLDPLVGFQVDGSTLEPVRAFPPACEAPLLTTTYVVAVDRVAVSPSFALRLPADEPFHDEARLEVVVDGETPSPSVVGSEPWPEVTFELLAMGEAVEPMGMVRSATTDAGYESLWASAGLGGDVPEVDLDDQVVVSITIPDDACPPELTGFHRELDTIMPLFVEPSGGCDAPLIPKTFVVAIDRAPFEEGFRLLLEGQEPYGYGHTSTVVRFDGPPPTPSCSTIESFSERILDVGIDYDYEPTDSPAVLLEPGVVAFRGVLTGGYTSFEQDYGDGSPASTRVGFEVEVTERLFVGSEVSPPGEREMATIEVGLDEVPFIDVAAASAGVPVVVVAAPFPPEQPRLFAMLEGFITACEGGPLLGRTGFQGEWVDIDSLDELADALRG